MLEALEDPKRKLDLINKFGSTTWIILIKWVNVNTHTAKVINPTAHEIDP